MKRTKNYLSGTILLFGVALILSQTANAQPEQNWWFFGYGAGLDFTGGNPVPAFGGQVNTLEGCASISDKNTGNLLFYTDGLTAWDRTHSTMPNGTGLMGDFSSTQSGVIVPKPGDPNIFFLFTVDNNNGPNGFRYSEVDMTLNSGFGDVNSNKNILLFQPTTEKVCAVLHCNGEDFWVVTHGWLNNTFMAYEVTSAGVNTTPVLSNVGGVHSAVGFLGQLKATPDGAHLGLACYSLGLVEYFDFDNNTGMVSNVRTLPSTGNDYGVGFSPDGRMMYVGTYGQRQLHQYDVSSGVQATIVASQQLIFTSNASLGSIQRAPDGKMYVTRTSQTSIGVINSPNTYGLGCNYVDAGQILGGPTSGAGLPNFTNTYPVDTYDFTYALSQFGCDTVFFSLSDTTNVDSVKWNFDDPPSGANDSSVLYNPFHMFTNSGTYIVNVIIFKDCVIDTIQDTVTVSGAFNMTTSANPETCGQCNGDGMAMATGGNSPYTYQWDSNTGNQTNQSATGLCGGTYWVTVTDDNGCTQVDSIVIGNTPGFTTSLAITDASCSGDCDGSATTTVTGGDSPFAYQWDSNTGNQTTSGATGLCAGTYIVTITDNNGCSIIDTITITEPPALALSTTQTDALCNGEASGTGDVTATGGTSPYSYTWNNNSTSASVTGLSAGTYTITVTDDNGCTQEINITVGEPPAIDITSNSTSASCTKQDGSASATATGGTSPYTYSWTSGHTTSSVTGIGAGVYTVTITDSNGCTQEQIVPVGMNNTLDVKFEANPESGMAPLEVGFENQTSGGTPPYTWDWDFGNGNTSNDFEPTETFDSPGSYIVILTVTDDNGCTDDYQVTIIVDIFSAIMIPNVFTPNSDGFNDKFNITTEQITQFKCIIYNRWGTKLYEWTNHPQDAWDGGDHPSGTYYYVLEATGADNKQYNQTGYITIIRDQK